jgi:hypothetical protein
MLKLKFIFYKDTAQPLFLQEALGSVTRVGAMRLFFDSFFSSFSSSLASRLVPVVLGTAGVFFGVSGGVVNGTPVTLAELVAVIAGTFPEMRGGLLTIVAGMAEDCVATEDVELDRVGEEGRCVGAAVDAVDAGGDGAVNELAEFLC